MSSGFQGFATPVQDPIALLDNYGIKYVIYVLVGGMIIATVLMLADFYYPFLPINPVSGPSSAARAVSRFWTKLSDDSENLVVPVDQSPTLQSDTYSMSVQLILADSRTPALGQFRHVLHRGSNPCAISVATAGPSGHAGITPSDLDAEPANMVQSYRATGLPSIMNPGLFLDRYKNDMHVFVHTRGKENGNAVLWLESMTVEDLPLNQPTTIGIVCNGTTLEVYVNCNLYSTMLLRGRPYLPPKDNQWFGRYCAYPVSGLVKNLMLWPTAINSSDYMMMCSGGNFSGDSLPSTCPTATS